MKCNLLRGPGYFWAVAENENISKRENTVSLFASEAFPLWNGMTVLYPLYLHTIGELLGGHPLIIGMSPFHIPIYP